MKSRLQELADQVREVTDEIEKLEKDSTKIVNRIDSFTADIEVMQQQLKDMWLEYQQHSAHLESKRGQKASTINRIQQIIQPSNYLDRGNINCEKRLPENW